MTIADLDLALKTADAEVHRLCREEYARSEAAKIKIAEARERAFAAAVAVQAAMRAEIARSR